MNSIKNKEFVSLNFTLNVKQILCYGVYQMNLNLNYFYWPLSINGSVEKMSYNSIVIF
jgi:hypothetical protein